MGHELRPTAARRAALRRPPGPGAWLAGFVLAVVLAVSARADVGAAPGDAKAALALSQAAIGRVVGDFAFRDRQGKPVHLSRFRGRPLLLSFVYTGCAETCPVLTTTLADAVGAARDALGEDSFRVVTVGFDAANDTPERMGHFAAGEGVGDAGWTVLSGGPLEVAGLADAVGFTFYRSAKGFDHLSQVTIIDAAGVVHGQVYGEAFATPHLVEPLKELVLGTAAPFSSLEDLIKRVRLYCTIYDPAADRYRFDYSLFMQIAIGAVNVGVLLVVVARGWWRARRRRGASSA